jgi:cytochrome P450
MTDQQLRDELMTIFLAGHETTANALTWTLYLLSQQPEVESFLLRELDSVIGTRRPTFSDVTELQFTEMVLSESMRLYPPAWAIGRLAKIDCDIGGYLVPQKSVVVVSQYVMHRDERYYENPLDFDPHRWTRELRETRPPFAYFPFGGGPRRCIGEGFAWMEGILLLATLAQEWQFRLVSGHPVALKPVVTLRPKFGMKMIVSKR